MIASLLFSVLIMLAVNQPLQNMDNHAKFSEDPDKIIVVSAILNCDIHSAFGYFAENSLLEKWLTVKADVEMKQGGKYELFWTPDDPDPTHNSTYGCKVLALDPPYFLNFEWRGNANHKDFMNNVRPLTNVTVLFHQINPEQTRVTLLHTGWRPGNDWEEAHSFFVQAWSGAFRKLEAIVNL